VACRKVRFSFCSKALRRFLSPLARLAVIRFSGNRGAKTLLLEHFSPFSQIPLSDPCPDFVSAQLRIDKSVLYIFSCSFLGKLLDNPGCSIKKFVNAHCKTSCLSVLCSVSAGEPENVSVKIVYSPCFLLFGGSCELFTGILLLCRDKLELFLELYIADVISSGRGTGWAGDFVEMIKVDG
jgi:hypothetical protein